jgi:ABC-type branched-subunit amino acid transport system substrate-binding protein
MTNPSFTVAVSLCLSRNENVFYPTEAGVEGVQRREGEEALLPVVRRTTVLVLAALLAAACGARLDEEVRTAAINGDGGGGTEESGDGGLAVARVGDSTTTTVAGGSGGAANPSAAGSGGASTGSGSPTGGDGGGGTGGGGGGDCVPSGASDVGITETDITLGEVSTISGPIPGIGQTSVNGVRAYLEYLNQTAGGVCGRTLNLIVSDDRLDTGVNRSETARLMERAFAIVGGWAVTDDGGATALEGSNVPDVGISISDTRAAMPNNFSSNPIPPGTSGNLAVLRHFIETYDVRTAAVVWGAQVTARSRAQYFINDLEQLGVDVSVQREAAITETNYVPIAQSIANAQSDLLITALEITGISRLAQAFQQVGYLPKVPYYGAQSYGNRFIEQAGSAANGAIIGITHPIIEEADSNPAVALFEEWYRRVNPGAEIDFFAFQGWVAAAMVTDAILAAGPSPTRDAVLGVLRTYTQYDAHGLVAPINPAEKQAASCFMIVKVENDQWVREFPDGNAFHCP